MASEVSVKWSKKFEPTIRNEAAIVEHIGTRAALMIKTRLRDKNRDSRGRPIRPLARGKRRVKVLLESQEGREGQVRTRAETRKKQRGEGRRYSKGLEIGDTVRQRDSSGNWRTYVIVDGNYARRKKRMGKRPVRNLELTGRLWRSLAVRIMGGGQSKSGKIRDRKIKIAFQGSDNNIKFTLKDDDGNDQLTKSGRVKRRSLKMRDKARLAFYGKATGKSGEQIAAERADLMRLSDSELDELAAEWLDAVELFHATEGLELDYR